MGDEETVDSFEDGDGVDSPSSENGVDSPRSENGVDSQDRIDPLDSAAQTESESGQESAPVPPAERTFGSENASERRGRGEERDRPVTHHTRPDPDPRDGVGAALAWFRHSDSQWVSFLRETLVSVLIVVTVGFLLFAISGVWPPLVAVESNSMDPHLQKGDLVLVMAEDRLAPGYAAGGTGVVTAEIGAEEDYERFGGPGDVIVYQPYGSDSATPIIHRAHLYVEEGENWYERADPAVIQADSCSELGACPAPTDGFITKGDNPTTNNYYDQERGISSVVEPEWVRGTATVRIPWVGWIRLVASDLELPGLSATTGGLGSY